jgi:poly-beta-1,6-N-acetyl-D-glucosamine synthase
MEVPDAAASGVRHVEGHQEKLRRRLAWLSLAAAGLGLLSITILVGAVVVASRARGDTDVGYVPLRIPFRPSVPLLIAAVAGAAAVITAFTALHTAAAIRVLARDRRIPAVSKAAREIRGEILSPAGAAMLQLNLMPELPTSALPHDRTAALRITVLIPAHNEEATIVAALTSLKEQTRRPEKVIVVADNCTDNTAEVAKANGAEVFTTVDNTQKKAGGLNQALAAILPNTDGRDVVMVMDADTIIVPEFLHTGLSRLEAEPDLIAVGGVFYGEEGAGLVGQLQRNEYTRYQRHISRRKGKVFVLTGTASLFRAYALQAVADARGRFIPGDPGHVYDTLALTEDNEMTLALKTLGARMVSPMQCRVTTEVMPTWRRLWRQRMRWQRGALENIGAYGLTPTTMLYWGQQIGIGYGTIALNSYLIMLLITFLAADVIELAWIWLWAAAIFMLERTVTVWRIGWRGRAIAVPLFIEMVYDLILQAVFVKSLFDIATGRADGWDHGPAPEEVGP